LRTISDGHGDQLGGCSIALLATPRVIQTVQEVRQGLAENRRPYLPFEPVAASRSRRTIYLRAQARPFLIIYPTK